MPADIGQGTKGRDQPLSETVHQEYQEKKTGEKNKNYLLDSMSEEMMNQIKELPEE